MTILQLNGWTICFVGLGLLSLIVAIAFWAFLPSLYIKLLYSQLVLSRPDDQTGQLPKPTYLWSHPPADTFMHFHMFNVENAENVSYFGAKPRVREIGPFVFRVIDMKKEVEFRENGTQVYYKNYRAFLFNKEKSCAECKYSTMLTMPNLVTTAALATLNSAAAANLTPIAKKIIDYGILLLGEDNFIQVPFGELMFDGYADALLSASKLPLLSFLSNLINNGSNVIPFPLPDTPTMALLNGYNNSNDMDYLIDTGLKNIERIGQIYDWAGFGRVLPEQWWSTPSARMINGSDAGTFQPPGSINRNSSLALFFSYLCRSFNLQFHSASTIEQVPCLKFHVPPDHYDTNLPENIGFRYSNPEAVNYFPNWPNCSASDSSSLPINFKKYCLSSFVGGTYVLPPGIFPVVCYPGRNKTAPFQLLVSPPHFAYSPPEVYGSVEGLQPVLELHSPMSFYYEPVTGTPISANIRFQTSLPVYRNKQFVLPAQLPNKLLPLFYVDTKVTLKPFLYDQLYLGVVVVPQALFVAKIAATLLAGVFLVGGVGCQYVWPNPGRVAPPIYHERFTRINVARF